MIVHAIGVWLSLARALRSGRRGRVFESRHPDYFCPILTISSSRGVAQFG